MYITLKNDPKYTDAFLNFVLRRLFILGLEYINKNQSKIKYVDLFLNDVFGRTDIQSKFILFSGLNNMAFKRINDKISIFIKEDVKVPFSNDISLSTVCKMIDQGNIEYNPFPIFSELSQYTENNIGGIYAEYTYNII